jgi:hypothetical protein
MLFNLTEKSYSASQTFTLTVALDIYAYFCEHMGILLEYIRKIKKKLKQFF